MRLCREGVDGPRCPAGGNVYVSYQGQDVDRQVAEVNDDHQELISQFKDFLSKWQRGFGRDGTPLEASERVNYRCAPFFRVAPRQQLRPRAAAARRELPSTMIWYKHMFVGV